MMLAVLLARAGVRVLVLEKHRDFLRDFRGDTLHASTLQVMHELGMLADLLRLPHQETPTLAADVDGRRLRVADFRHLPTRCRFIAFMPQWDFLDFLARQGGRWPAFGLRMEAEVTDLLQESGRVIGVRAATPAGPLEVHADLVVGADGRGSVVRERAALPVEALGAPIDVLWFRLPRAPQDEGGTVGRFRAGAVFVMIDRGAYWQCGYVIAKGGLELLRARGLEAFRERVTALAGVEAGRTAALRGWDDVKLLTVRVDRARRWWRPGLLCIGDAAHAMSPVGGVGINLAVQDAVAAANLLAAPLRERRLTPADLRRVERRRTWPTRITQRLQTLAQNRVVAPVLQETGPLQPPLVLRLVDRIPCLQRLPGRLIGLGLRPEHVRTPRGTVP